MYLWTSIVRELGALEPWSLRESSSALFARLSVCLFRLLVDSVDSMQEGAGNGT
jgi:hypothetical protein